MLSIKRESYLSTTKWGITSSALMLCFFIALICNATRPDNIGADTEFYRTYYQHHWTYSEGRKYEFLFHHLIAILKYFNLPYQALFSAVFLIITFTYFRAFNLIAKHSLSKRASSSTVLLLAGLLLLSSWYLAATTNGLRQGIAIPFTFLAILSATNGKWPSFIGFIIIAAGFHYSALLFIPFALAATIKLYRLFLLTLIFSIFYATGITERFIEFFSSLFQFDLYSKIKSYGGTDALYYGFQPELFIYTIFWALIYYFLYYYAAQFKNSYCEKSIRLYLILILPYLLFGFGGFSNRYAFYGWLYLPILHTTFLSTALVSKKLKFFLGALIFILGLANYIGQTL